MTEVTEPRQAEDIAVTLVRIESGVGNILEKVQDLRTEVTQHRGEIHVIQSQVQQLQSDAGTAALALIAADKAREDTASALEKQTAEQVKKAKDAVDQSVQRWTPAMRLYATLGAIAAVVTIIYYLTHPHG
jgi:methyl-accepting chemotaxis protein